MLQILGESFLVATRMDDRLHKHAPRPQPMPPEAVEEKRRGWLHFAGILL